MSKCDHAVVIRFGDAEECLDCRMVLVGVDGPRIGDVVTISGPGVPEPWASGAIIDSDTTVDGTKHGR